MIFNSSLTANFADFIEMCSVSLRNLLTYELEKRKKSGTVHKRHSQSGKRSIVQCKPFSDKGEGEVLQMRTSALLGAKNPDFSKFMVCPHGQGVGGQFFAILSGRLLWTAPCFFDFLPLHLLLV